MQTILTVVELLSIWVLAFIMGISFTKALLPNDIEKEFGTYIAPTVGYLVFCLIAFTTSSTFGLHVVPTCWGTLVVLLLLSFATQIKPLWRINTSLLIPQIKHSFILMIPMALVCLFPLFYMGATTYLGAVNPDYFSGVVDNYYLLNHHSVSDFKPHTDTYFPIDFMAGTTSASARFGAGVFGILVQLLSGVETRTSLTLIIGFFLLSLPLILYFFTSVVLGFNKRQATLTSWLIGISAPIGMSYLYYYLGQNSGLPVLPLVMAAAYLMLVRPSLKTLVFCALVANALFVNYFAMLPYALAPAGVLALYLLLTRQLTVIKALGLGVGFLTIFVLLHLGNINDIIHSMQAWGHVIGQTLQGQFFLEFLTELFVPFILGVVEYPINNSWLAIQFGDVRAKYIALVLTLMILIFWMWSFVKWLKNTKEASRKVFIVSAFVIYFSVWWFYSFPRQYAYAVFKMSSWLQFIIIPFISYGLWQLGINVGLSRKATPLKKRFVSYSMIIGGYLIGISYIVLNGISSGQYIHNGFGRNTTSGYIVNNFEMSGNTDYFELADAVSRYVKPTDSVSLLFVDSIQNYWVSYYLKNFRQSIPFHEIMPGDDENLPDIQTNTVMDYYGDIRLAINPFAHDYNDNYFLTWNKEHLNQDIVDSNYAAKPIWENHTFRLFDAHDVYDILASGRGFYRLEFIKPNPNYWMPHVMRWSAHGGEFYLLRVKNPGKPYRLAFDTLVGYEAPSDSRTLEFWLNGKQFQTLVVTDNARVISKPFYPKSGMNKIVVLIKENNGAMGRKLALWNNDIPEDYRRLNTAFANVHILTPTNQTHTAAPQDKPIRFAELFDFAKQFDGLQLDGWIGEAATISLPVTLGVKQVELKGFIPGWLGFTFPYKLSVKINGMTIKKEIKTAGNFTLNFPIKNNPGEIEIVLNPSKSVDAGQEDIRHKKIKLSIRIESIQFS